MVVMALFGGGWSCVYMSRQQCVRSETRRGEAIGWDDSEDVQSNCSERRERIGISKTTEPIDV